MSDDIAVLSGEPDADTLAGLIHRQIASRPATPPAAATAPGHAVGQRYLWRAVHRVLARDRVQADPLRTSAATRREAAEAMERWFRC